MRFFSVGLLNFQCARLFEAGPGLDFKGLDSLTARSIFLYLASGLFILAWWSIAFQTDASPSCSFVVAADPSFSIADFSPLKRSTLRKALSGDFSLMAPLIYLWNKEADLLEAKGVVGVQRLSSEKHEKARTLSYALEYDSKEELAYLNRLMGLTSIKDDLGQTIDLKKPFQLFYPHTYVAASFLLALAEPEQIVGVPKGMRRLTDLYEKDKLDQISTHLDFLTAEKLYVSKADLAFVSPYSHPAALKTLRDQQLPLYTCKHIETLSEIQQALINAGHVIKQPVKAQLLAIFMEAAFLMIDNRLRALHACVHPPGSIYRFLSLYHSHQYMLPTTKSLAGQLLQRLLTCHPGVQCPIENSYCFWRTPIDQEKIRLFQPDFILISTSSSRDSCPNFFGSRPLFHLDETVQESPTQYLVLAYFDLFNALSSNYSHAHE